MSIIANTFIDPPQRARAIGVWGATAGVSLALGPVLGGVLTQAVGWRSVFWVNVPVGLLALVLTTRFVPESRAAHARRADPVGQALVVLVLATLTATLIGAPRRGWHATASVAGFALAAVALLALIVHERRHSQPLIDLRFFRSIPLSAATVVAVLMFASYAGTLFLLTLYLQELRGLEPARAGICLLPTALALLVCSPLSGRWVAAGRTRAALLTAGLAVAGSGALLLALDAQTSLARLLIALALLGIGMGFVNAPITNASVSGLPRAQAGVAAGLTATSRQIGATLGVALVGSLAGPGARAVHLAAAPRAAWWLVIGAGLSIAVLGIGATGERARRSSARIAALLAVAPAGARLP
jgi:EmrB/QacA subfamily drug resistance transporter